MNMASRVTCRRVTEWSAEDEATAIRFEAMYEALSRTVFDPSQPPFHTSADASLDASSTTSSSTAAATGLSSLDPDLDWCHPANIFRTAAEAGRAFIFEAPRGDTQEDDTRAYEQGQGHAGTPRRRRATPHPPHPSTHSPAHHTGTHQGAATPSTPSTAATPSTCPIGWMWWHSPREVDGSSYSRQTFPSASTVAELGMVIFEEPYRRQGLGAAVIRHVFEPEARRGGMRRYGGTRTCIHLLEQSTYIFTLNALNGHSLCTVVGAIYATNNDPQTGHTHSNTLIRTMRRQVNTNTITRV